MGCADKAIALAPLQSPSFGLSIIADSMSPLTQGCDNKATTTVMKSRATRRNATIPNALETLRDLQTFLSREQCHSPSQSPSFEPSLISDPMNPVRLTQHCDNEASRATRRNAAVPNTLKALQDVQTFLEATSREQSNGKERRQCQRRKAKNLGKKQLGRHRRVQKAANTNGAKKPMKAFKMRLREDRNMKRRIKKAARLRERRRRKRDMRDICQRMESFKFGDENN